jgi:ribosomal protein L32
MMSRIVLFVLVLFVVWRLLSSFGKRASSQGLGADSYSRFSPRKRRQRRMEHRPGTSEELVACARCGTYVPRDRALPGPGGSALCGETCDAETDRSSHEQ